MLRNHLPVLIYLFTIAFPWTAISQERSAPPGGAEWFTGLAGGTAYQSEANIEPGDSAFSLSRFYIQPSLGYARDRRTSISLSLGLGEDRYDFTTGALLNGNQSWDNIRNVRLSLPLRFAPSDNTDVIIIPSIRSYAAAGVSFDEGRTEGVIAGASLRLSDRLSIGPGFGWFSELGGDTDLFPILLIDWKFADNWELTTGRGLAATRGPGLNLAYRMDRWKFTLSGRYEKTRFALDHDGAARIGENRNLPLLFRAEYSPWPMTTLSVFTGTTLDGRLALETANGTRLAQSDYASRPLFGISFSSRF